MFVMTLNIQAEKEREEVFIRLLVLKILQIVVNLKIISWNLERNKFIFIKAFYHKI